MWRCGCCNGTKGTPVLVPYMPVRGGARCLQPFCSWCDQVDVWPNYTRTAA